MTWVYLGLLGVVATGLSTAAFFYMVFKQGPLFAGMTTYVVPMLAMVWGMFDHEQISTQQLAAMAGVFVMVGLVQSGAASTEDLVELLPEATTDNVMPPPHELYNEAARAGSATFVAAATSDSVVCSSQISSA
jgi:hypothetical protein